jgi:tryptophan-rich sensory protein
MEELLEEEIVIQEKVAVKEECPKVKDCECEKDDSCFHYWYFGIVFLALVAIFIINYLGVRCHNYDWFNKHVDKEDCGSWIAYGETITLFWSILILILAFAAIRLYGQARGRERTILMSLYLLVLVLTVVQVYVTFEAKNFQTGFLIGILLVILAIMFAWYAYRSDSTSTVLIILYVLYAIYATAVDTQLYD